MRAWVTIAGLTIFWMAAATSSSANDQWLEFRPSPVELAGHFEIVLRFGPPNYGEDPKSDMKIEVPMLVLAEPIRVRGRLGDPVDEESVEGIRMLQLLLPSEASRYDFIDKQIVVTGELSHSTRGPEFTPVLMKVSKIRVAD